MRRPQVQFKRKPKLPIAFGLRTRHIRRFKKVHDKLPIYSVRIDLDWRAVGILKDDAVIWFWIGPHSEYERLLAKI